MTVPAAPRTDVVDVWHGVEVPDPYRWLEDTDAAGVRGWVDDQNQRSREALDVRPERRVWHERLVALMRQPVIMSLQVRGGRVFTLERRPDADQAILAVRPLDGGGHDAPRTLVDPTAAPGADATTAIDWFEPSPDGSLVAYGTSIGGTERSTLRIVDVASGHVLDDEISETRACSLAWEPESSGFFYTRYPPDDEYHRTVHHHQLGVACTDDPVVWAEHPKPEAWPAVDLSPDGHHLLVHVGVGWSRVDVHLLDRRQDRWSTLIEGIEVESQFGFVDDERLVGTTTLEASNGRLVTVEIPDAGADVVSPDRWRTILAERDVVLGEPHVVGDEVWVVASSEAIDTVERRTLDGGTLAAFDRLGMVSVLDLATSRDTGDALILVNGFDAPPTVWHGHAGRDDLVSWWHGDTRVDAGSLTVRHVSYPSLDGTQIGLFLVHRDDVTLGAQTPTILDGYGGFSIAEAPTWRPEIAAWCEAGGLYAVAGLRGGLEHGEAWHLAGNRSNKQNVFDDFAAAGDWLVDNGYTSRDRLAIVGRSNGGLLVGATMTQRPNLCRAVWCGVPLLDMIRFPRFLIARLWTAEYGDPEIAEEFAWLHAYSPYHRVVPGTRYPATLFTCAEGDSRVHPSHARKMAALVQEASSAIDERPVLFIEEGRAGHGVGKPVTMRAAELADALTFLGWQLDWSPDPPS